MFRALLLSISVISFYVGGVAAAQDGGRIVPDDPEPGEAQLVHRMHLLQDAEDRSGVPAVDGEPGVDIITAGAHGEGDGQLHRAVRLNTIGFSMAASASAFF